MDGVFIAIGHKPNTKIFEGQLDMKDGYIITKGGFGNNSTGTSCRGYLLRAMCKTSHIDKPLPVQRVAVWLH